MWERRSHTFPPDYTPGLIHLEGLLAWVSKGFLQRWHRRARRGAGELKPPPPKISGQTLFPGQTLFSGHAQLAKKSGMIKHIPIQWIQGKLCFSGQAQSGSKILNDKKYIQYSESFQISEFQIWFQHPLGVLAPQVRKPCSIRIRSIRIGTPAHAFRTAGLRSGKDILPPTPQRRFWVRVW